MQTDSKIGVGVITCNREKYLQSLLSSLRNNNVNVDEIVVVNDGTPLNCHLQNETLINNVTNIGVGKSKNKALQYLMNKGCKYLFLLEDDIIIKKEDVFQKYINACKKSGIQHFNFAFHGNDNYTPDGKPAVKLKIEYNNECAICLYPNVYGAFSFYTSCCIEKCGVMDEFYINAMEHVDHTNEIIKKGMHPPFRWFADIADSQEYISEQDQGHSGSEIRKDQKWIDNFHKAADYFANKQKFDVRNPYAQVASKEETIEVIKQIKKNYGRKNNI